MMPVSQSLKLRHLQPQILLSYNCSPSSSWYASYSSEYGAGAVRSACSCLRDGNDCQHKDTKINSKRKRNKYTIQSRSGTLITRSTVLTTTISTRGSTIISTETSITTNSPNPTSRSQPSSHTRTTQVPISAPSSFRLYYNLNGGRQYAISARRPGQNEDQDTRFLSSSPSNGDTFTLDTNGRLIDTKGANAIAVATDQAPYKYLYLDQDINNLGPNVPRCTWCNGPLNCDYPAANAGGNSSASNSTSFYSCGGGFLVLSESNSWVEGGSCQRVTMQLEGVRGGEAAATGSTSTSPASTTTDDRTFTSEPTSDATTATTTDDGSEPTTPSTDDTPPVLRNPPPTRYR
ncbi:uncharacterized protein MYCFIDRAFT_174345 [Pseudocercospora fijiensis CIRAD86]|uniref:Uncharacterized protein n=1 Tax=Pseudocercospora fijiensis (strain CIRAD86) TaxID=383855 RepID=M2ZUY9_PSEFD|nr:uncharacterized protein MYCFIDRAFT_174345 [Pseudocercospora fijiensis CIRAD86]EME82809.1 hypothetical protein MYCFIDRAFT_174345 [Pseudocercospora fijiensis CIRAD86]